MAEGTRRLILVKHAMPEMMDGVPAAAWSLSDAGREACGPLAAQLAEHNPSEIITSVEPKAAETGARVAARLGLRASTAPGLHERDQGDTPLLGDASWRAAVETIFARPDDLIMGRETATAAGDRFVSAVTAVLEDRPAENVVIIAHGTVISLFVARTNPIEPFDLWLRLGLPSFVVLDTSDGTLIDLIERVE